MDNSILVIFLNIYMHYSTIGKYHSRFRSNFQTFKELLEFNRQECIEIIGQLGLHPYEWTDMVRRVWRGWFSFC